jgi:hypothetical protein
MFQLALASGASGPIHGASTRVFSDLQLMRVRAIWGPDAGIHPACPCVTRNGVLRTGCGMLCMKNAVKVSCRRLLCHPARSLPAVALPLVLSSPWSSFASSSAMSDTDKVSPHPRQSTYSGVESLQGESPQRPAVLNVLSESAPARDEHQYPPRDLRFKLVVVALCFGSALTALELVRGHALVDVERTLIHQTAVCGVHSSAYHRQRPRRQHFHLGRVCFCAGCECVHSLERRYRAGTSRRRNLGDFAHANQGVRSSRHHPGVAGYHDDRQCAVRRRSEYDLAHRYAW